MCFGNPRLDPINYNWYHSSELDKNHPEFFHFQLLSAWIKNVCEFEIADGNSVKTEKHRSYTVQNTWDKSYYSQQKKQDR